MFTLKPALAGFATFLFTLGVDLGSKTVAVSLASGGTNVYLDPRHNGDAVRRVALSLAAVLVVYLASRGAQWRGIGRLWGAWVGVGLLVGGIAGNGVSHSLWRGTPDFIWAGNYVWNLADFAIGIGLVGALLSTAVAAARAAWRDRALPAAD